MRDDDYFYEYADKIYEFLVTQIVRVFSNLKARISSFDELNVLLTVDDVYKELKMISYDKFYELAERQYERMYVGEDYTYQGVTEEWLYEIFHLADPTTKYIYENELDRKKQRCYEGILTKENIDEVIKQSMNYYARMVNQATLLITQKSTLKAFVDSGIDRVMWVTENDSKVCHRCEGLNGKIFVISKLPSPPHIGCRCTFKPIDN